MAVSNYNPSGIGLAPRQLPTVPARPVPGTPTPGAPVAPQQQPTPFKFTDGSTDPLQQNFNYGDNEENRVNQINRYLEGLSPTDLIKRYQQIGSTPNSDVNQYDRQQYGVTNQAELGNYTAYKTFKDLFGRDPNANEFAQILPAFGGPNGITNGRAALANMQQQYKLNPTLDPNSQQNTQKPADVSGSVQQQFQSVLGRAATPDELAHFSQAIQSGQTDAYGLSGFLKTQPEYTNAQDATFRGGLNSELSGYDQQEFNREKGDVISAYGKNGMAAGNSPSLDYALTDLMGKIASNRGSYLANLSASQYGGNKDLAVGNYQNTLNQMYSNNQNQRQQQSAYGSQLTNQGFAGADYQTQMQDYQRFMNSQPKSSSTNPLYGAVGGLVGAGAGAFLGPAGSTAGASLGYQIGSGSGGAFGYLNR